MSREDLIKRIAGLSEEEFASIGPVLEMELDSIDDYMADEEGLDEEIRLGLESARTEGVLSNEEVQERIRRRLAPKS